MYIFGLYRTEKESFLTNLARDNVQLLINRLFQLPTARVDNDLFVSLPPPTTRLPRAKPVPKAKQLTKWEKYAKEKGITKRKKDKLEWDEELNVTPRCTLSISCYSFMIHNFFCHRNGFQDMGTKKVRLIKKRTGLLNYLEMPKILMTLLLDVRPKKKKQSLKMSFKD